MSFLHEIAVAQLIIWKRKWLSSCSPSPELQIQEFSLRKQKFDLEITKLTHFGNNVKRLGKIEKQCQTATCK